MVGEYVLSHHSQEVAYVYWRTEFRVSLHMIMQLATARGMRIWSSCIWLFKDLEFLLLSDEPVREGLQHDRGSKNVWSPNFWVC